MPSTALASRIRFENGSSVNSEASESASSQHNLAHGQAAYGARGRQKDTTETTSAAIRPDLTSQAQKVPTEVMRQLGSLPVRRAWRGRSGEAPPDVSKAPVVEAIMLHERGEVQASEQQCPKCQRGEGVSPECVKIPSIHGGACSNCLIARALARPGSAVRLTRSYSAERRSISATISPSIPKEDLIAVWNLIAGVMSTQPQDCLFDDGTEPPGKRIEDAARLVARSADEWGHSVREGGSESSKSPKTPAERQRLVRQANRIRETALQIANCARDWGEKLERKRSTSQLRG
ncbi:hypothetical protein GCG54_00014269 [Colletotrichum gloeosporioides]|uniref:Uncharacterized protein n=1 Tax=Colletotrichum gloeosporioides TaxID=474922 RepID=A0A8H4CAR7_COLGL|nr:uncharacterized protein GCG54_00014269 [Colletotrichum gloeosporioides]KAF3800470.1 hypothetical protein GCG54_00014269 [Colletotrichum gloeosporioides]